MTHKVSYTTLPGGKYGCATCGEEVFRTLRGDGFMHFLPKPAPVDPLIEAIVDLEIAEDEYAAVGRWVVDR